MAALSALGAFSKPFFPRSYFSLIFFQFFPAFFSINVSFLIANLHLYGEAFRSFRVLFTFQELIRLINKLFLALWLVKNATFLFWHSFQSRKEIYKVCYASLPK